MKNIKSYLTASLLTVGMLAVSFSSTASAATLGVPTSVKFTSTTNSITVSLHKASGSTDTGIECYTKSGTPMFGTDFNKSYYFAGYLKSNTIYKISLTSLNESGKKTIRSKTLVYYVSTKMTAPASPTKAKVSKYGKNIKLVWTRAAGATGYEVYRSTAYKGKYIKVTTTSNSSFVNSVAKGHYYYYKVRAYKGNVSTKVYSPAWSNLTCIKF